MKDDAITDELRIALDNVHEAERKRTVVIHHMDAFDRSRQKGPREGTPFEVSIDPFYSRENLAHLRRSVSALDEGHGVPHNWSRINKYFNKNGADHIRNPTGT